jgi:hypothetical protein
MVNLAKIVYFASTEAELERETRLELATLCLGSRCSTAELLPPNQTTGEFYAKISQKTSWISLEIKAFISIVSGSL